MDDKEFEEYMKNMNHQLEVLQKDRKIRELSAKMGAKSLKKFESIANSKKSKPERKLGNIMKARSDLKKEGDKYIIDTNISIEDLDNKTKKALIKSIVDNL